MTRIVSSLPGRIRVRDKSLRDRDRLSRLKQELLKIAAITEVEDRFRTGSVVVLFDRNAIEHSAMETSIDFAVDKIIGEVRAPKPLLTKKNINRYNKMLMLSSLGASLFALTIARRKRRILWHKLTGYIFIANLGVHFYFYRKSLLRLFR